VTGNRRQASKFNRQTGWQASKKRHATADPDTPVGPKINEFFQGVI